MLNGLLRSCLQSYLNHCCLSKSTSQVLAELPLFQRSMSGIFCYLETVIFTLVYASLQFSMEADSLFYHKKSCFPSGFRFCVFLSCGEPFLGYMFYSLASSRTPFIHRLPNCVSTIRKTC